MQSQLTALNRAQSAGGAAGATASAVGVGGLRKWGSQLQWAGRQLSYNFTLPIALAAGAATKFALDNEKAMVRVTKVYGDGTMSAAQLKNETTALGKAFEALSNHFGVAQADVINIAADWAAAGSSGLALAKATKLTLETMILGEMDAQSATTALISIQAQYGQSTDQLSKTIDQLNNVENQTGTSMQDLIITMAKTAGVARTLGVDTLHLAAFTAALVPAAGSAAQAGNGLKTILTRLATPTGAASNLMKEMGIDTESFAYRALNGTQKVELMAKSFDKLADSQKNQVSKAAAGLYQISRFDILMRDVASGTGYYAKALKAASDAGANYTQKQKELNQVLNSNPQKLKQEWVILQNSLADIIQPAIPVLVSLGKVVAGLFKWFSDLPTPIQHMALAMLGILAVVGPLVRYLGAFAVLFSIMNTGAIHAARGVGFLASGIWALVKAPYLVIARGWWLVSTAMGAVFGPVLMVLKTAGRAMYASFMSAWKVAATAIMSTMSATLGAMGRVIMLGMTALGTAMSTIWAMTWGGMRLLMFRGAGLITAAWQAFSFTLMNLWRVTTLGLTRIWIIGQSSMFAVTAAFRTGMTALFLGIGRLPVMMAGMFGRGVAFMALTLRANLGAMLVVIRTFALRAGAFLLGPWGIAIMAAIGIIYAFRGQLESIWNNIVSWFRTKGVGIADAFRPLVGFFDKAGQAISDAFWKLPSSITGAFIAVVKIVAAAAMKVYELFSYLNPFAHHSPSLVESVTGGIGEVIKQYARVGNVGSIFGRAANDLAMFKNAAKGLGKGEFGSQIEDVGKAFPQMLPMFMTLIGDLDQLNGVLAQQKAAVDGQQRVVDAWKARLDAANASIDAQQNKLDRLQAKLTSLTDAYDKHKQAMQDYASAPIQGMKGMTDAIFANDQAQKKLQLQIAKWEQANGSIDDMKNKMASLAGDIEKLKGEATDLHMAGAGSDVLGPINKQINLMQKQSDALGNTIASSPISDLQKQLDALAANGNILELEKSLKFDPQLKAIDDLANGMTELPFDQIIKGINSEKASMAVLQPQIDSATKAVNNQKDAVDRATVARDAIQKTYDAEGKKLDVLKNQYDATAQAVRDITDALNELGSAASQSLADAKKAGDGLGVAADIPDVGGAAQIGREGGLGDQSKQIDDFTKQLADETAKAFGGMGDMFKPLKQGWSKTWAWLKTNIGPTLGPIGSALGATFGSMGDAIGSVFSGHMTGNWKKTWDHAVSIVKGTVDWILKIWNLFYPDFKKIFDELVQGFQNAWNKIGPQLAAFGGPLLAMFSALWTASKPILEILGITLLFVLKVLASIIANTIGPAFNALIGIIAGVLQVFRGLIEFVVGVFTGDWAMAWQGIKDIFIGTFDVISSYIVGFISVVISWIKGFVGGIVGFFEWLYDVLVGHSIIPDLVNKIIEVWNWLTAPIKAVWNAIWTGIKVVWDRVVKPMFNGYEAYLKAWATIFKWIWDNVISKAWSAIWTGVKAAWDKVAKPLIDGYVTYIKAWATVFKWIWDNVISKAWSAIWTGIKDAWDKVAKPLIDGYVTYIKAWATVFKWIWDNVISKAWSAIWTGIKASWDTVGKPIFQTIVDGIVSVVNAAAGAVNSLIHGINKIAGIVHLSISIPDIPTLSAPKFAKGGMLPALEVGNGFVTNQARAIVGEASSYPEYVIPTDPKHRGRARQLYASLGSHIQEYGIGGVIGGAFKDLKEVGSAIEGAASSAAHGAAGLAFKPFKDLAQKAIDKIPVEILKGMVQADLNGVDNFIKGVSNKGFTEGPMSGTKTQHAKTVISAAMAMNLGGRGAEIGLITALVESNLQNYANSKIPRTMELPHDAVGKDGYSAGIMQQQTGPFGNYWGTPDQVMNPNYAATRFFQEMIKKVSIWNNDTIPQGAVAQQVQVSAYPARYQRRLADADALIQQLSPGLLSPARNGGTGGRVPGTFAHGGIADKATLGIFGEAGREVLAPLTPLWNRLDKIEEMVHTPVQQTVNHNTTVNINGNLEFPNIKSTSGADEFLSNLRTLVTK